jgi:hypothetical protein
MLLADLWLAIAGAILATIGQQLSTIAPKEGTIVYLWRAPAMLASAIVPLAAYFSAQALSGERDKMWVRCRAAAESIKSAIYLDRAGVAPFDTSNRSVELGQRIEKTLQDLTHIELRVPETPETNPVLDHLALANMLTIALSGRSVGIEREQGSFKGGPTAI